jgi:hypothetical protein
MSWNTRLSLLALACLVLVSAALHERVRHRVTGVARPHTSLRVTRVAYASWNRMALP